METEIDGHCAEVHEPPRPSPHGYVVLYLHDDVVRPLHDDATLTAELNRFGLRALAPESGRSWWTDRIWPGFDLRYSAERFIREHAVAEIEQRWGSRPPQIALVGEGMGGQGALRIAFKHPNVFPVVAALSPAIDCQQRLEAGDESLESIYGDGESARQDSATLHVHPLNWPRHCWFACDPADREWFESSERLHMKMSALGIPFEADLTTTATSAAAYRDRQLRAALRFTADRLDRERLKAGIPSR